MRMHRWLGTVNRHRAQPLACDGTVDGFRRRDMTVRSRRVLGLLSAVTLTSALALAPAGPAAATGGGTVPIQLLAINDFHGNLEAPQGSSGTVTRLNPDGTTTNIAAGGVEFLSTALQQARAGHPNTITVGAGDLIGASPLLSAAFHD